MAVRWLRSGVAVSSAVLRTSKPRTLFLSQGRLPTVSVRWSTAAALKSRTPARFTAETAPTLDDTAEVPVGTDQPEFRTLEKKVSPKTLQAITSHPFSFTHMSAVQAAVLPLLPELAEPYRPDASGPRDLLVKAKTGTGKTLAFLVPAIEARIKALEAKTNRALQNARLSSDDAFEKDARRNFSQREVGALIVSPTRELATQIATEAQRLTHHHKNMGTHLFVGGSDKRMQIQNFRKFNRDIVVGTPGRLRDLLENEPSISESLRQAKVLILDEADTLLDMGFREEIEAITAMLPDSPERQTFLFSATVSPAIQQIARSTLHKNHLFVNCVSKDAPPVHTNLPQYYTVLPNAGDQVPHILRLLAHDQITNPGKSKTIIFLPTTKMTQLFGTVIQELTDCLPSGRRTRVYEIHSKLSQNQRTRASSRFRESTDASVLVSSDVSARGVDYPGVTRVIQVGIPSSTEQYTHRVGRTGRGSGKYGRADLVVLPWEAKFIKNSLGEMPLKPLPIQELSNHQDIAAKANRLDSAVASLVQQLDEEAVRETMISLLGYYLAKSDDMRVQKQDVLSGLSDWSMQAGGLTQPPHISDALLTKLGMSRSSRTKSSSFNNRGSREGFVGPKRSSFGISQNRRR